jgi:zinc protease
MRFSHRVVATVSICLLLVSAMRAEPLPADERNQTLRLDNGLAVIVRPHANPPGRAWVYLHIRSGALNETAEQNGLAHFLEHMAFNGSTNFPPGTLIPMLNKLGMQFGPDTNAHTAWTETVYKLNLPDTKPETLDLAVRVMADYAGGLLLTKEEIDRERQVILEEARSNKGAAERIRKKTIRELFAGSHLAAHDVIGDEKIIATAPREQFVDYYDTWYRPELMTLIVVGDIDADAIQDLARKHLSGVPTRAPAREPTKAGLQPLTQPKAIVLTDPEQVAGEAGLVAIRPGRPPITTYAAWKESMVEQVANWIVNRRLAELVSKGQASFRGASLGSFDFVNEVMIHSGDTSGEPEDWSKMLEQIIVETNRARQHGVTERELKLAEAELISNAEHAVQTESTMDASILVDSISDSIDSREPALSAKTELELTRRLFSEITVADVNASLRSAFAGDAFAYIVVLPEKKDGLKVPTSDEVMAVANAAWAKPVEPPESDVATMTLLEREPEPGEVESTVKDEQLAVTTVTFDNGVVLRHRFSDYKKDQVLVRITLGGGRIEETDDNAGISLAAGAAFDRPATGRLSSSQIRDLLVGKTVSVAGSAGFDSFSIAINGSPKDLPTGLQLAHALITDIRLELPAFDDWKRQTLQSIEQMKTTVEGNLALAMHRGFLGGDVRLGQLTAEQVNALDREAAETWLRGKLLLAPIELAVVGDISVEDATQLAARYLGSLPKRPRGFDAFAPLRKLERQPGPWLAEVTVPTVTPKAIVLAGFLGADEQQTEFTRPLNLAAMILSDRMNERIREKEQLVYSIDASHNAGRGMPGTGFFFAAAPTDPDKASKLADTVLEMLREFAKSGPTEEEMQTARKQIATQLNVQMKQPGFWVGQLADLSLRGRTMDYLKQLPDVYQTLTAEQLREVASRFFKDEQSIRLIVKPETTGPTTRSSR